MTTPEEKRSWFDRPLLPALPTLTGELVVFLVIVAGVIVSRLYGLGDRAMSHDEALHVYYSWLFANGQGFSHTPLMHGPLQFHLIALVYQLFGDSDFTARLPHALASIATVILLWKGRRYLGRTGTLIAAGLVLISPFMLFYGRYARNEAFVALFGVMTLYAILRYLETGKNRYLFLLTVATALHFTSKETAFIYTAQALLYLAIFLINRVSRLEWKNRALFNVFVILLSIGLLLSGLALGLTVYNRLQGTLDSTQTSAPINPEGITTASASGVRLPSSILFVALAAAAFLAAGVMLIIGYGWANLRRERSFDMLILLGTFVLPQMAAFPVRALGWNPLDYIFSWPGWNFAALWAQPPVRTGAVMLGLTIITILIGLLWDTKRWPLQSLVFWGIYVFSFTSMFTNWEGFFTGAVGSLGYWLEQQGVARGNQPWYYYLLVQIPVYEFLPALGLCLATYFGLRRKSPLPLPSVLKPESEPVDEKAPVFGLLLFWSLTSLLAYTIAGEKMPWLTVHITLPMILLSGWGLGQVIERINWPEVRIRRGGLVALLGVVFFICLATGLVMLLGANPPFQGKLQAQLAVTNSFLFTALAALGSGVTLGFLLAGWQVRNRLRMAALVAFSLLSILTGRAAFRAVYVNQNDGTEYLVYAHGASGVKDMLAQIELISAQTTGGEQDVQIAYDAVSPTQGVSWPIKWYLRNYPDKISFDSPGTELSGYPLIVVDRKNFENILPIVGDSYYEIDYLRMVWPNQDYFNLTWDRVGQALADPAMRGALLQIWLDRDYSQYAAVTGKTGLTGQDWSPSAAMKLYVRKDIAAQIWGYGIIQEAVVEPDPYENGKISLTADLSFGILGNAQGQFNGPHGIAAAPDGSIFIADTNNHRIQHFSANGEFINAWGSFNNAADGPAPLGTFNEPWGIALSPDGEFVYVVDTWNHRIQKFTADGSPLLTWGFGNYDPTSTDPFGLWGPRGIAVDGQGRVFVADTGNKRIQVYDQNGNFLYRVGSGGMELGQFEEPVGLAFDAQGLLYVADTWNQRIQVFVPGEGTFDSLLQWEVAGWYTDSLENKPYLAVDSQGHVFVTDPDAYRVLEFSTSGDFVQTWGDFGIGTDSFGLTSAVAVDSLGRVWVTDAANNRVLRFILP